MAAPLLVVICRDRITVGDSFLHSERMKAVIVVKIYAIQVHVASKPSASCEIFCRPNSDTTLVHRSTRAECYDKQTYMSF